MGNSLVKKLRGYQKAPRDRFLMVRKYKLSSEEFFVYELGIALTDWDTDHKETYGTFYATNAEMAFILGWKSDSTVSRIKIGLISKGLFTPTTNRIRVLDFEKWQLRSTSAKLHDESADIQDTSANLHEEPAELQVIKPETPEYSLGSFKGELRVTRTTEEYQRIWEESFNCSPTFTPDDMRWIDLNVYESSRIPS